MRRCSIFRADVAVAVMKTLVAAAAAAAASALLLLPGVVSRTHQAAHRRRHWHILHTQTDSSSVHQPTVHLDLLLVENDGGDGHAGRRRHHRHRPGSLTVVDFPSYLSLSLSL